MPKFTVQKHLTDYSLWGVRRENDGIGEGYKTRENAQKRARQLNDYSRRTGYVIWGGECYLRRPRNGK